jgi:hypothetical protein
MWWCFLVISSLLRLIGSKFVCRVSLVERIRLCGSRLIMLCWSMVRIISDLLARFAIFTNVFTFRKLRSRGITLLKREESRLENSS